MDSYRQIIHNEARKILSEKNTILNLRKQAKIDEIYNEIPALNEIESQISKLGYEAISGVLSGKEPKDVLNSIKKRTLELTKERKKCLADAGYSSNSLSISFNCPKCKDKGFLDKNIACDCIKKILAEVICNYSDLDYSKIRKMQLSSPFNSNVNSPNIEFKNEIKTIIRVVDSFRQFNKEANNNFYFYGPARSGKTYIAKYIFKLLIESNMIPLYVSSATMLTWLGDEKFNKEKELNCFDKTRVELIYKSDVLIIDDLGYEFTKESKNSFLFSVLNSRLENDKATIIILNIPSEKLQEHYSEQIVSRILSYFKQVKFIELSLRKQNS